MARPRKKLADNPIVKEAQKELAVKLESLNNGMAGVQLGDTITCHGQSFILNTPKGNRCAVCNKRYYPGDEPGLII